MTHDDIDTLCMKIAVELEIVDAIGLVTTRTIGNTIREQIEPFLRSRIAALEAENAELKQRVETAERDANQADDDKDCVELVATEVQAELAALEKRLADAEAALRTVLAYLADRQHPGSIAPVVNAARSHFAKYAAQPKDKESRRMTEHVLKTTTTVWDAVESGQKRFEVRRNDRFFQQGDVVVLRKWDNERRCFTPNFDKGSYATFDLEFKIGWMLHGGQFGIEPGYVVFQLEPSP